MRTISASDFEATCRSILAAVPPEGLEVVEGDRVIARVLPPQPDNLRLFGIAPEAIVDPKDDLLTTDSAWHVEP